MAKAVEFYPGKQGRPLSLPEAHIPINSLTSAMLTNAAIDAIMGYAVTYEGEVQTYKGEVLFHK